MVLVQNWGFYHLFFLDNIGQENVFYDILERKNTLSRRFRKICLFLKGLFHCFVPKLAIIPPFYFRQYRPGKCVL